MEEKILSSLGGVSVFGAVSLGLFFAFFIALLIWAIRLKPPYLKSMGGLPLEADSPAQSRIPNQPEICHE